MDFPPLPGWHFLGQFAYGTYNGVGSWLLHHKGEALLLELPPGLPPDELTADRVRAGLKTIGAELRFVTASHSHEDHLDPDLWNALIDAFPDVQFLSPDEVEQDTYLELAGEPVWLIKAPKHSPDDIVTIFRGTAMTGDIETGMLKSVNREVPKTTRKASMDYLRGFQDRTGYHVHTAFSAHMNSFRHNIDWEALFTYHD